MTWRFFEVENGGFNWGKFGVGTWDHDEWRRPSQVSDRGLLISGRGWSWKHLLVLDLQTGEGAIFLHGGKAKADLQKHAIWVCPLYLPFLEWLYQQDLHAVLRGDLDSHVLLPDAPSSMSGRRWPGEGREESP